MLVMLMTLDSKANAGAVNLANDPVLFGEAMLRTEDGQPIRYWDYQKEDLRCQATNIIHKDGRDVGKTVDLFSDVFYTAMRSGKKQGLIATPWEGPLSTIISYFELQTDNNILLAQSIEDTSRKPYHKVIFTNGYVLHFRMSGARGDAFRSLHVNHIWVDEGAYMPEKGWNALWRCQKNMKDKKFRVWSTPDGRRDTTYYRLTHSPKWKVFHWPSWLNPNWNDEQEQELLDRYGSKDSPGWLHEVAGEHGQAAYGAFDMTAFDDCFTEIPEYERQFISGEDIGFGSESEIKARIAELVNINLAPGTYVIGADLGYTADPTEIVIKRVIGERVRCVFRLHADHVTYDQQAEVLARVIELVNAAGIAIDNGGNGTAVVQILLGLDKYRHLQLDDKLFGVNFGGSTVVGEETVVNKKGDQEVIQVKVPTKKFMTDLINGSLMRRHYDIPAIARVYETSTEMVCIDEDMEYQYAEQSYSTSVNGRVVYSKGNDHIIDADRCAFYAVHKIASIDTTPSPLPVVSGRSKKSRKRRVHV